MLRQEVFEELRYLDALIQNATVEEDGEYFAYKDICAKWQDECFRNDILSFTGNFTTEEIYGKVSVSSNRQYTYKTLITVVVIRAKPQLQPNPDLPRRSEYR